MDGGSTGLWEAEVEGWLWGWIVGMGRSMFGSGLIIR